MLARVAKGGNRGAARVRGASEAGFLRCALEQHAANMADGPRGVQALWTNVHAILNTVTTEHAKRIIQT